jgi:uracil-DNA glycosylase
MATLRDEMLAGIDIARWEGVLPLDLLDAVCAALDGKPIAPPAALVFEALRRVGDPARCRVVIVGQDPYPTPGDACGLSFGVPPGTAQPESLRRIDGALARAGLRKPESPPLGDLRPWASQGVLLLNRALTTAPGERRAHAAVWKPFTDALVARLCRATAGLHFMLWGGDARSLARAPGHVYHEWSHPSPLADNKLPEHLKFRMFDGFAAANSALRARGLRPICWDTTAPVVAYTDGSCLENGSHSARAGYGVIFVGGALGGVTLRGPVPRFELELGPTTQVRATSVPAVPTNNRAELLAIATALARLIDAAAIGPVEVVSDNDVSVRTLNEWLPARVRKGTAHELKNWDLVRVVAALLDRLRAQAASVVVRHVHAHTAQPPASASARERLDWLGNKRADELAGSVTAES